MRNTAVEKARQIKILFVFRIVKEPSIVELKKRPWVEIPR
jgi:hypothetical protein